MKERRNFPPYSWRVGRKRANFVRALRVTRESSSFRVGSALVAAARNPSQAWKLPSQLWQVFLSRGTNKG